ncbi:MAG: RNA 2',3'-cyclic phosphodiesterase [Thermoplasmatales archaeon]|nr:RNA 2',3'-cyclic phosphodiesterase [Thermoplasmatales archaeon]
MRAFIAIDVRPNDEIKKIFEMLKESKAKLKLVELDNIHLTIKFLGEIDESLKENVKKVMEEATKGLKPFKGRIEGLGCFPNLRNIRVIWMGFHDNGETLKIANYIDEKLVEYGIRREESYKPHITIARMKSAENKEKVLKVIEENKNKYFGEIDCNSIKLKQSILRPEGPIYKDLEEILL